MSSSLGYCRAPGAGVFPVRTDELVLRGRAMDQGEDLPPKIKQNNHIDPRLGLGMLRSHRAGDRKPILPYGERAESTS